MEKYSAYRDPGTGIQPFLSPVPPQGSESLATILKPVLYLLGIVRTALVLLLALLYAVLVQGLCRLLLPVPPLHRILSSLLSSPICRLSLFVVGVYWIPTEVVRRKRGRFATKEPWSPGAGDIIVSNWISWLEIAWLAFRFNPTFVLPITESAEKPLPAASSPSRVIPGRRTGTGSAAISLPAQAQNRAHTKRAEVLGFIEVSLLRLISSCGYVPPFDTHSPNPLSLEEIRSRAKQFGRPLVVFPECTTSNGRGLLRFSNTFKGTSVPVTSYKVFVMCVRIDPPTALSPTLSLSIPSTRPILNPITQIFSISASILPHSISIRLLAPSDSPSSGAFVLSEVLPGSGGGDDVLTEACATLISEIGRVKRTGMGWEDKTTFLDFFKGIKTTK